MKFIYVAKKNCKYFWDTSSHTFDECVFKIKQQCKSSEYLDYTICFIEYKDVETYILV